MVADVNFRTFLVLRLDCWRQAGLRLRRGWGQAQGYRRARPRSGGWQ